MYGGAIANRSRALGRHISSHRLVCPPPSSAASRLLFHTSYIHTCIHTYTYIHTIYNIETSVETLKNYINTIHTNTYIDSYIYIHTYIHTYIHAVPNKALKYCCTYIFISSCLFSSLKRSDCLNSLLNSSKEPSNYKMYVCMYGITNIYYRLSLIIYVLMYVCKCASKHMSVCMIAFIYVCICMYMYVCMYLKINP